MTTPTADRTIPEGFRVRVRDDVLHADGGRTLVGGSPVRAVRLGDRARSLLASGDLVVEGQATARLARRLLDGNLANPLLGDVAVPLADLTVVVPVRDRTEQLARCLAALVPLRVVVVDDASEEPHRVAEVAHRHGARVHRLTTNVGPAGARNAGLRLVRTPLVAFVDSDVTVDASRLLDLARHCADPQVALVGPQVVGKVRSAPGRRARWFERYDAAASSLDLGSAGGVVRPGAATGWLPSACLVGRTDLLAGDTAGDTGGFEDGWRVAEDVDLVWRLVDAGHVVRYDPGVRADHDVRGTVRTWLGRKFFYGTGGADLAARHGDKVAPAVLSPMMALSGWALLLRRWWSLPVAAVAGAVTARRLAPQLPVEEGRTVVAARLAAKGTAWTVRQEAGLLLRHWWPLAALAAPFSRSVRRALATAVVIDLAVFLRERTGIDPLTALVARRLDDLAYGSGLWWGAIRRRSARCLLPRSSRVG